MQKHSTLNKINHFLIVLFSSLFCISGYELKAQLSYKVLFLGNSYTGVNNLPQLVHDVALSAGDTLIFDSYTPGGYQLVNHAIDVTSLSKLSTAGWDYVVLQGQSQEPITQSGDFGSGVYQLNSLATQSNPCSVTMLYMTWGRKNGDASNCANFPEMCTYEGMDSTLRKEYLKRASYTKSEVSPVSVVWHYLRQNYPGIELYQPDESHPSTAGSYAAACCFYAAIFKKDPTLISFDFGLSSTDAAIIRNAAKTMVFDTLSLWDYKQPPSSDFFYNIGSGINEANFISVNHGFQETYLWDFGDGDTASSAFTTHSYLADGIYTISLTTTNCDLQGLHTSTTDTVIQFCSHTPTIYTDNPWLCNVDTLWTQMADSYQWYDYEQPLPQTTQYLPFHQYNSGNFSVLSTVNGCSELSEAYSTNPQWSGYYFDYSPIADPCVGDTVSVAVAHFNGFLSGAEIILWYKNDTLLPLMTNEDTLIITTEGTYECKVINPNANCPLDTTYVLIEYDCGTVGIKDNAPELSWSVFPNPASESITIKFTKGPIQETIQIYNVIGSLIKSIPAPAATIENNIADLPSGLYFIRLKNNKQPPLKFIKL